MSTKPIGKEKRDLLYRTSNTRFGATEKRACPLIHILLIFTYFTVLWGVLWGLGKGK